MAASFSKNSYGRRLSELLQEQQEPFLPGAAEARGYPVAAACKRRLLGLCAHGFIKKRRGGGAGAATLKCALSRVLCSKAVRRVLRWDLGCFSGGGGGEDFRRLPRSGDIDRCDAIMDFDDDDGATRGRQLSPVSVLELHSDEASPTHSSHWEDGKPSTSGSSSSPSSEDFLGPSTVPYRFAYSDRSKACAMEVGEEEEKARLSDKSIEEQISSWEKIAEDISKVPSLVEHDFSSSVQEWRRLNVEVSEIGSKIESMIFEEIRREAVCDMIASPRALETASCC